MNSLCALVAGVLIVACEAGLAPLIAVPGHTTYVRTPHHDSAIVHSDQFGGNFAYSVSEGHAYQTLTPYYQPQIVTYQWPSGYPLTPQVYYQHPHWIGSVPVGVPGVVHSIVPGIVPAAPSPNVPDVVEVESPAGSDVDQPSDNDDDNEPLQQAPAKDDDDSVSVESA